MKICLISNLYKPWIIGGAEIYVENIAKGLSKHHEVFIITSKPFNGLGSLKPEIEFQDNIKIYRFYPANVYHTYYAKNSVDFIKPIWHLIDIWNPHSYIVIKSILKRERPDIVHTHNIGGLSPAALYAAKSCKIPVVHTLHDYSFLCPRATLVHSSSSNICNDPDAICRLYRKIKNMTTNKLDIITGPSKFVLDMFDGSGFFPSRDKIIFLPLGLDISSSPNRKEKDTFDILYVGQVVKHKGVDVLIEAFRGIPAKNIRLHLVGTGYQSGEMKKIADDPRIILHGYISDEQKNELFSMADVCVVPSIWYENSPLVIYESFFHGLPVVGSRIGGIPELIKEGYNGLLFEAGNPKELRQNLQYLMNHPGELRKMGEGALESAKEYTIQAHINKLENIYTSLLPPQKNEVLR
jgi:glycosyltransferase involved in cell wall biosynthesis